MAYKARGKNIPKISSKVPFCSELVIIHNSETSKWHTELV